METYRHIQQLNFLVATVDDLLADSTVAAWHSALLEEVKHSFSSIQQKATTVLQEDLIGQMMQQMIDIELKIRISLEAPLKSLCRLADMNHISLYKKVQLLLQVGKTYDLLGQWNQALDVFYQTLDFCTDSSEQKAETRKFLGHIKSKQRDYSSATKLYFDSIAIYTSLQNKHEIANIYLCQGYNEFEQGNYEKAEDYYRLALQLAPEEDRQLFADRNNNLGIMAAVRGDFDDAITYYTQAIEFYESLEDIRGLATAYQNLALLQVNMRKWKDAGESYQRALEYTQQDGNIELMGMIQLTRAELALKLYDFTMAQACCKHALKVFGRLDSQTCIAEAYKILGCVYRQQQKWEDAGRLFERSIQINDSAVNVLGIGETRYEYGLMYYSKGDKANAKQQLTGALEIFEKLDASLDIQKVKDALEKLKEDKQDKGIKIKRIIIHD